MDDDLQTIDLTLRITCEVADAARFPLSAATWRQVCRAVAETLALDGRFYVAPHTIAWPSRVETDQDIAALGIEGDISEYSFIDGRYAYLEEDCDYGRFAEACTAQGVPLPEITDQYVEWFNRHRPRFGDAQFSPEFWDKLRR